MARIFIAIRFNDEFKRKLVEIQDSLKLLGVEGNYCSYGNLHITLAFIGEMTNVSVPLEGNRRGGRAEPSSLELCLARRRKTDRSKPIQRNDKLPLGIPKGDAFITKWRKNDGFRPVSFYIETVE